MKKQSLTGRFLRAAARAFSACAFIAASSFASVAFAADQTYNPSTNVGTAQELNAASTFSLNYSAPNVATQGGGALTGVVSGSGNLTIDGTLNSNSGGLLLFSANNTYTGDTTIRSATLRVSGLLNSPTNNRTYAGHITLEDGTLDLRPSDDQTLSGRITGTGNLTVASGTHVVTLTNTHNTFAGVTTVASGTLALGGSNVLSPNSDLAISAVNAANVGTLDMRNLSQTVRSLLGVTNGTIDLGGLGALTVNQAADNTYAGKIVGGANSLFVKSGTETLSLAGANLSGFSGKLSIVQGKLSVSSDATFVATTNEIAGGTLLLASNVANAYTKDWTVTAAGGAIEVSINNSRFWGDISGSGTLTKIGTGALEIYGKVSAPLHVSAGTLGGNGTVERVTFASGAIINPGIYAPARNESAIGTLNLGTDTGTTQFNDVVLQLNLQGTAASDRIAVTGKADFGVTAANTLSLLGSGAQWVRGTYTILTTTGALATGNLSDTVFQYNGVTVDMVNSRIRASLTVVPQTDADNVATGGQNLVLNTFAAASLSLTWNQTGRVAGEWNKGAGALANWREDSLVGQSFVDGDIVIFAEGTGVQKSVPVATAYAGTETAHNGVVVGSMIVSGSGFSFSGGTITGVAKDLVGPGLYADGKLHVLADASATFANDAYFAGVEIAEDGKAVFKGKFSATTVRADGQFELNRVADSPLAGTNYNTFAGAFSGNGTIDKTGNGDLTLSGNNTNFAGTFRVLGGKVYVASDDNLGSGKNVLNGGTLQLTGRSYFKNWELDGAGGTLTFDSTRSQTGVAFYGTLEGTGGLTKAGTGILYLAGANTYSGPTVVTSGIVEVSGLLGAPDNAILPPDPDAADSRIPVLKADTAGNYAGNITLGNGTLSFGSANAQNLSGIIGTRLDDDGNAQGTLAKSGTGTLKLEGNVTHTFATLVANKGDTVVEGNLNVGAITVGSAVKDDAVNFTIAGNIKGASVANLANATFASNGTVAANVSNSGKFAARGVTGDFSNNVGATLTLANDQARTVVSGALANSGLVKFTRPGQTLEVGSLGNTAARNGTGYYEMSVDFAHPENSDAIKVASGGAITGAHVFHINASNLSAVTGDTRYELVRGGAVANAASFYLDQPIMAGIYRLTTGDGSTPTLSATGYSPAGRIILGTTAMISADWFAQLDNLSKRQGDLHLSYFAEVAETEKSKGVTVGAPKADDMSNQVWIRAYGQQVDTKLKSEFAIGEFREFQAGADIGYDYAINLGDSKLFLGVFVGFLGTHRDFLDSYDSHSDTRSVLGGLYASWMHKAGWYADLTLKGQRMTTDFRTYYSRFGHDSGSFDQSGMGFSLEFGKRFTFADVWFVEPAVQIAATHFLSGKYRFGSAGSGGAMDVRIEESTTFRYGLQARVGRLFGVTDYGFVQPYLKFGLEGQSTNGNDIMITQSTGAPNTAHINADGVRGLIGFGISWQLDKSQQIHFDYEASFGDKYTRPWNVNLGYRYNF